jgi:hypothetical protein
MVEPPVLVSSEDPCEFCVELERAGRPGEEPSLERRGALVMIAAHSIKHLSKSGGKLDGITRWVEENFPDPASMTTFVLNIPVVVLTLISSGVLFYSDAQGNA